MHMCIYTYGGLSSEKFRKAGNPLRKKLWQGERLIIPPNPTKEVLT
jgi:hypothetical protein